MHSQDTYKKESRKRRTKGAVSVFLTIILVPCIVVACLFDDVSRVQFSKAEAESAADLALHSLLSNYDNSLKEYYGLVASCQDIESFYDTTIKYFKGMMAADGISGEGQELFVDYLNDLKGGKVTDFLQADIVDLAVSEVQNAKLGENPVLIEDGIVEFMKYRGPVEITKKVVDRFSKMDLDSAEDAKKDEPIINSKKEYAEAETELLKDAFITYLAIKQYSDAQQSNQTPSKKCYDDVEKNVNDIADDLRSVTEIITLYYAATHGIKVINFPSMGKNSFTSVIKKSNVGYKALDGSDYYLSRSTYDDIVEEIDEDLPDYINEIRSAGDSVGDACIGITYEAGITNPAMYCMKMQETVDESKLGTIRRYGEKMLRLYARIKAALECGEDPESVDKLPDDWRDSHGTIKEAMTRIDKTQSAYLDNEGNGNFGRIRKRYYNEVNAENVVNKVRNRSYSFQSKYCGEEVDIGTFISRVNMNNKSLKKVLKERSAQLQLAIKGGMLQFGDKKYKVKSLTKLRDEAEATGRKLTEWNSRAKSGSTEYAKEDTEESNKALGVTKEGETDINTKSAQMAKNISAESVDELERRLTNIKKDIDDCIKSLEDLKYGNSALSELENAQGLITAAIRECVPTSGISMLIQEGKNAAGDYSDKLIKPEKDQLFKSPAIKTEPDGNDMELIYGHRPALYKYLCDQFEGKETNIADNVDKAEDNQKKWEKEANDKKEKNKEYDEYTKGRGTGISGGHGGTHFNAGTGFQSLLGIMSAISRGDISSFRDKIYVVEYIMDMFSWSSFNNEGKYKLVENMHANTDYPKYSASNERWDADNPTDITENQSLTNLHFNNKNNKAFLGEVEYILYGNHSWEDNVRQAYNHIFAIRELVNLTSGFMLFSSRKTKTGAEIEIIANAIATATAGVIPPIATKCILITVISTMESCKDLEVLKKGAPVTIYKTKEEQWYYSISPSGANTEFSEDVTKIQPEDSKGMYYSDYMYVFLLLSTMADGGTYKSILLRTGDVIEANMRLKKSGDYDLAKSKCYFKINALIQVKPLMLSLPIVDTLKDVKTIEFREQINWRQYTIETIRGYS